MDLNRAIVLGKVTSAGPKMRWDEKGTAICSFWLDVSEVGKDQQTFHSFIPVEIAGAKSEETFERLAAGMEILVGGKLRYRSTVKEGVKSGGLVLTSWFVTLGATTTPTQELPLADDELTQPATPKKGKNRGILGGAEAWRR